MDNTVSFTAMPITWQQKRPEGNNTSRPQVTKNI
jgi:hypothetical protein